MPAVQIDTYLDPSTGDLPEISRFVTGIDLVEQRIRLRLRRGTGEWFLDPDNTGLPLIAWRQMKPPDVQAIVGLVQTEIRAVPGVVTTKSFSGVHDIPARRVTITGDVVVADGQVTSAIISSPVVERNAFIFAVMFVRGSGPIVRPLFRGF